MVKLDELPPIEPVADTTHADSDLAVDRAAATERARRAAADAAVATVHELVTAAIRASADGHMAEAERLFDQAQEMKRGYTDLSPHRLEQMEAELRRYDFEAPEAKMEASYRVADEEAQVVGAAALYLGTQLLSLTHRRLGPGLIQVGGYPFGFGIDGYEPFGFGLQGSPMPTQVREELTGMDQHEEMVKIRQQLIAMNEQVRDTSLRYLTQDAGTEVAPTLTQMSERLAAMHVNLRSAEPERAANLYVASHHLNQAVSSLDAQDYQGYFRASAVADYSLEAAGARNEDLKRAAPHFAPQVAVTPPEALDMMKNMHEMTQWAQSVRYTERLSSCPCGNGSCGMCEPNHLAAAKQLAVQRAELEAREGRAPGVVPDQPVVRVTAEDMQRAAENPYVQRSYLPDKAGFIEAKAEVLPQLRVNADRLEQAYATLPDAPGAAWLKEASQSLTKAGDALEKGQIRVADTFTYDAATSLSKAHDEMMQSRPAQARLAHIQADVSQLADAVNRGQYQEASDKILHLVDKAHGLRKELSHMEPTKEQRQQSPER